jgi:hypothetical protein
MRGRNKDLLKTILTALAVTPSHRVLATGSSDIYSILPSDLDDANETVEHRKLEWKEAGAPTVADADVDKAGQRAAELQAEFDATKGKSRVTAKFAYLQAVRLFVLTRLPRLGKLPVLGGAALLLFAVSVPASAFLFPSFWLALGGAVTITAWVTGFLTVVVLILWPTEAKRIEFHQLYQERRKHRARIEELQPVLENAWSEYRVLNRHFELCESLKKAEARRDHIAETLASAKYQLVHTDWRSLRDVDFERFLFRVFEVLGYQVQLTKASGDQGVDLVVTGKGRRLAVQAKGYQGSVSNHAVMEVVAGMAFYQCDSCAVITNSRFTSTAKRLASAHGTVCILVDGTRLVDLIEGRIF